jgi:phage baseplate assembly protein W
MLLRTHPGERLGNPTFGCRIHQLLFEPMGNVEGEVEAAIREAVDSWLPYIVLHKVEINESVDPRAVYVHITYSVDTDLQATTALAIEFSRGLSGVMSSQVQQEYDKATETWYYTGEADPFYEY